MVYLFLIKLQNYSESSEGPAGECQLWRHHNYLDWGLVGNNYFTQT